LGDFELNMSGLQEFDLVATPIHEYYGPSIGVAWINHIHKKPVTV
jgi:hypothetical protein